MSTPVLPNGKSVNFANDQNPKTNNNSKRKQKKGHNNNNNNVKSSNNELQGKNSNNKKKNKAHQKSESYAGSSFHGAAPKLSDLPKPSFKPTATSNASNANNLQGTKISFNDLVASNNTPTSYPGAVNANHAPPQPYSPHHMNLPPPSGIPNFNQPPVGFFPPFANAYGPYPPPPPPNMYGYHPYPQYNGSPGPGGMNEQAATELKKQLHLS